MPDTPDWTLIDRWLAGEAGADDTAALEAWAAETGRRAWLDALRAAHAPDADRSWDSAAAWRALTARGVGDPTAIVRTESRAPGSSRLIHARGWRAAAGLLLAVGLGATALWWRAGSERATSVASALEMRELRTPNGTRSTITLDDGSRVVLNAGSALRYPARFGAGARDVWLEGEGYFDVVHDPSHPFRVHAGAALAEDLGTRFAVRAYAELAQVDVVVEEGLVALRRASADTGAGLLLRPGRRGLLRGDAPATEADAGDLARWTGWTRGELVLDAPTLREALPRLERWYDVAVTIPEALGDRSVYATFRDAPLHQVLDALALSLGARWTRDGRTITFVLDR